MRRALAREALLLSVSAEIWVHIGVFVVVVIPIVAIALPVVLVSFAFYESFQSIGALWNGAKEPDVRVAYDWLTLFVAILLLARFLAGYRGALRASTRADAELAARLRQPKGSAGQMLRGAISRIWLATPCADRLAPDVVWYSSFQVAAHARSTAGGDCIFISSALWDRIAKRDLTADLILAHEMGHVLYRDWRTFRRLSVVLSGIQSLLGFSKVVAIAAATTILVLLSLSGVIHHEPPCELFRLGLATVALSALCYLLLSLSGLFVRRYASFIVALMEVRADTCAALWTVGLDRFAQQLESDDSLHRSTAVDLARSIFSADMTHISESERLALIRMPERLFTPKLRYFAWSVVLALLLPLNPITPLLFNGAVDHAILVSTVSALYASAMTMLVLAGFSTHVSWKRAAVLATVVCCALGSTSINLYEIGYLLTHYGVALANGTGFGRDPVTLTEIGNDVRMVVRGLETKTVEGMSGRWIFLSVALTLIAMKLIRPAVSSQPTQRSALPLALVAAASTFCVALSAGRDPWRSGFYDYLVAPLPMNLQDIWVFAEPVRLALPALAGLLSVFAVAAVIKFLQSVGR